MAGATEATSRHRPAPSPASPLMLETLFTAAPEAMLFVDSTGAIRLANRRAEELFAYAPRALVGRSIDTLVPAAVAARHGRHRASYHLDPRTRPMGVGLDLRGRRADGVEFPIDVALGPAEFEGEQFVVAIVRDITVRKRDHDELLGAIPHDRLMSAIEERIVDRHVLKLLRATLRSGVMQDGSITRSTTGTPQGGVISPCLCNVYLQRLDRQWTERGTGTLVRYADDLLALCRTRAEAEAALAALRLILAELGLELKDAKTRIVHLEEGGEGVDFLGFRHRWVRANPCQTCAVPRSLALTQGDAACPRPRW